MTTHAARRQGARTADLRLGAALSLALALSACGAGAPGDALIRAADQADRFAAALFAPAGPQTRTLAASPLPVEKPKAPLSAPVSARDPRTGAQVRLEPQALGSGAVEVTQSDGCVWRRDDWFAPSTFWRGCGDSLNWRDGSSEVAGGEGLWPLRLGAKGRFQRRAVSATGRSYARETVCRVRDAVEVLHEGRPPTPAFVVDCADGKRVRTTWWSPDEGPVAFRKIHERDGVEEVWVAE